MLFNAEAVHLPVVRFWLAVITALETAGQLPEHREATGKEEPGGEWQNLDWPSLPTLLPVLRIAQPTSSLSPVVRNHHPVVS